jgi:hypothetical protein
MNFVSVFQGTMQVGSLDGPETIDACAKAALAHNAIAAVAAARSTWIPESMLSPFCRIELTDCRHTGYVGNGRHRVRDAGNLAGCAAAGLERTRRTSGMTSSKASPRSKTTGMRERLPV